MKVQDINSMVQIRKKRPRMTHQDKQAYMQEQETRGISFQAQGRAVTQQKCQKVLDSLLLEYSCRVKHPSQAIRSKLSGENIVDVKEDELFAFTNLTHLDLSDNSVSLNQLAGLLYLQDLDLQYNNLHFLAVQRGAFPKLTHLRLSYNKIPPSHLMELSHVPRLEVLEIASNDLCTLPSSLFFLRTLQELDLSSNNFNSESVLVNPNQLFESLNTIPQLRKLNLSRNKLKAFHSANLPEAPGPDQPGALKPFPCLEELNFSFNLVEFQKDLMFPAKHCEKLRSIIVTGNPFALTGAASKISTLEKLMEKRGGLVINETPHS
jgi:Leucine-rich repeat (LRR) protein